MKDDPEEGEEAEGAVTEAYNGLVQPSPARGDTVPSGTKSLIKHSDSSFGLHSPDSFNDDVQVKPGVWCLVLVLLSAGRIVCKLRVLSKYIGYRDSQ